MVTDKNEAGHHCRLRCAVVNDAGILMLNKEGGNPGMTNLLLTCRSGFPMESKVGSFVVLSVVVLYPCPSV
jgi:hypothetical protein